MNIKHLIPVHWIRLKEKKLTILPLMITKTNVDIKKGNIIDKERGDINEFIDVEAR